MRQIGKGRYATVSEIKLGGLVCAMKSVDLTSLPDAYVNPDF